MLVFNLFVPLTLNMSLEHKCLLMTVFNECVIESSVQDVKRLSRKGPVIYARHILSVHSRLFECNLALFIQ